MRNDARVPQQTSMPDAELAEALRQTLNQAINHPDAELDAALSRIRRQTRQPANKARWAWGLGTALAASLALFMVWPHTPQASADLASVPSEDLQFLEDLDMLQQLDVL